MSLLTLFIRLFIFFFSMWLLSSSIISKILIGCWKTYIHHKMLEMQNQGGVSNVKVCKNCIRERYSVLGHLSGKQAVGSVAFVWCGIAHFKSSVMQQTHFVWVVVSLGYSTFRVIMTQIQPLLSIKLTFKETVLNLNC